jgi:hypothetical protein
MVPGQQEALHVHTSGGEVSIPSSTLQQHFLKPAATLGEDTLGEPQPPNTTDKLTQLVVEDEVDVEAQLPWQSSPGPDGVDYRLWKATPASTPLLTAIYNTCQVNCRFPEAWKKSNTILIG